MDKQNRMAQLKAQKEMEELAQCTFIPHVNAPGEPGDIDSFLQKQQQHIDRRLKSQKELELKR